MRLEAVDKMNPNLICVATVGECVLFGVSLYHVLEARYCVVVIYCDDFNCCTKIDLSQC